MNLSKLGLLFVIFVDLAGQGLLLPIVNSLAMDPRSGFLSPATPPGTRHLYYGLIIGVFYLFWFFGAVYISKLSDSIGRKNGILICLGGALVGYALTILAVALGSLWMIVLGRAIAGFTSGNQPIAQAAMADLSSDDAEKSRNMGYCVSALSVGLVTGPIMAGILSDQSLLGPIASLSLPFYTAAGFVVVSALLIIFFFEDKLESCVALTVRPVDVFLQLWKARQRPTVLRISAAFFFFMLSLNACYVFIDNYLSSRFQIGTFGASVAMLVLGGTLVTVSALLVGPATSRFAKNRIVACAAVAIALATIVIVASPSVVAVYFALIPIAAAYALGYPTMLTMFSASVDDSEQGWVMGVSTALWTSGAGLIALIGGGLMSISIVLPFVIAIVSATLALTLVGVLWRSPDIRRITSVEAESK